jgi:branched-chain amino acid transport system substrate-binding protein
VVRLATVLVALALVCAGCVRSSDDFVVGAVYPTTGPQGAGGSQEYHGALLAADYANAHGGVDGKHIAIDLHASPSAEGVPTAVRALAKKTSVVIGSYGSTLSVVAAHIAAQHNVVFWETGAVGDMPGKLPRSDRFFRVAPTGEELGAAAVDFVRQHVLHTSDVKYGVAYVDDVYGQAVGGGAIAEIERHGSTPVRYNYSLPHTDFNALARRIAADKVNVLVVAAYIDDGVALRRALVRQHVPLLANIGTSSSYCMPQFGARLGPEAVGVYASDKPDGDILRTGSLKPEAVKALEWARTQYRSRYGGDMPAPSLAGFAGAWALFHDVLPKTNGRSASAIAAAAHSVSLAPGSLPNGSGLLFGPDGDNSRALTVIWKWIAPGKRAVVWPPAFATAKLTS